MLWTTFLFKVIFSIHIEDTHINPAHLLWPILVALKPSRFEGWRSRDKDEVMGLIFLFYFFHTLGANEIFTKPVLPIAMVGLTARSAYKLGADGAKQITTV